MNLKKMLSVMAATAIGVTSLSLVSVSAKDIADALKEQYGADVDKKKIVLHDPIKTAGEHRVELRIHAGVAFTILVNIVI